MTIVYVLIAVFAGWMIGFYGSNHRASKKIKAAEAKAKAAIIEAEKKNAEAQALIMSKAPAKMSEPGLLSLVNINGVPFLEMDGAPLNVGNISTNQKMRLFELLASIRSWVEDGQPLQPVEKPAPISPLTASAAGVDSASTPPRASSAEANVPKSLIIIAQIDAVLQARLANSPLAGKGIHLTARTSSGGVQVHVGAQKYPTLADVPDQQIKAAIRAAITEWEEKHAHTPAHAAPISTQQPSPTVQPAASAIHLTSTKLPHPARPANEKEFRALSIVAQIDTLLQDRLVNTPLAERRIRLIERTSLGGVEVYVGDQKYPSLDDVPDQQIKEAIRATIVEWERKYTPGT